MCIVSNIVDGWRGNFQPRYPQVPTLPTFPIPEISRAEFNALRAEVEQLKKLLLEAKNFDEMTGQPDCEMESKLKFMKQIAKALGIDMNNVFEKRYS